MKTIVLYGELAKKFGKHHKFAVKNVAEAIRALRANFRGFEQYMCGAHLDGIGFRVFVGGSSIQEISEINNPSGEKDIIRIVPVLSGSGSGWVKILIGVALVAAAIAVPGLGPLALTVGAFGAAMIIGGVSQLLTHPPSVNTDSSNNSKQSYIFSGPQNVSSVGSAIPVGYGRMMVGSVVISAGVTTSNQ